MKDKMTIDIGIGAGQREETASGLSSDQPTCDLLTQRLQIHEKTAWLLRSRLE